MNNNEDEIDLRLALGSRTYSAQTRLNSRSGAGVNANSRADMPFAPSDPLSELVWSPHNGLSLKCANSSLLDNNRPFRTWNPTNEISTSMSIESKGSGDIKVSAVATPTMPDGGSSSAGKILEENREGSSKNVQIADIAESSKKCAEQDTLAEGSLDRKPNTSLSWNIPTKLTGLAVPIRSYTAKASEGLVCSHPNMQLQHEQREEVISASGNAPISIPPPTLMRLEYSAENDLGYPAAKGALSSGELAHDGAREKGKEKASSNGNIYGKSSNDEDDSHESMESCNSAGLLSRGMKRENFDHEEVIGSKRMRKQVEGTSIVKPDSSFMNWISNMVKGHSDSPKQESFPLALTLAPSNQTPDCTKPVMGFQTLFQSLYCRTTKVSDSGVVKDNQSLAESRELMMADEKSPKNLLETFDGNNDNSCKQIVLSGKEANPRIVSPSDSLCGKANSSADKRNLDIPLPMSCVPEKSSPLSSLWITRLFTRTARLENQITEEARDCSPLGPKANLASPENDCAGDEVHASEHEKVKNSEAMASVFAKRLDALRHIVHRSEKRMSPSSSQLICFFCGGIGHDLRFCPQLTETELENLLVKISSFDQRVEEYPCLCIQCFQLDHWAISCPFVSLDDHKQLVSRREKESSGKRLSSSSSEHHLKGKQVFSPGNIVDSRHVVRLEEVFYAIRKLRLSRADILRWMSSNVSLSHLNGFFLRLRLGKVEGGLGRSTYYVACIMGDTEENVDCKSKNSILVDVGGIKSSVGSQYISNHDFLEDEIKAWWSGIVKTGGKIPSLHELNSKLEDRKRLGL